LSVFETTLAKIHNPEERAIAAANVARAAAATGDNDKYQKAQALAISTVSQLCGHVRAPEVYATLAFAAAYVGDWSLAEETANLALEFAIQGRNASAYRFAEDALKFAQTRHEEQLANEEVPTLTRHADRLAHELIHSLQGAEAVDL
jgi:hypothetical protein